MAIDSLADPYNPTQSISSVLRGRSAPASDSATPAIAALPSDSDYLNIPAFLRRQAD